MQLTVIGTGYVGLVVGAGLAHSGNDVICADIDQEKIARLNEGAIPIHEPGLGPLVRENLAQGRLRFTTDIREAVRSSELLFIAVGTPADEDGSADVKHVLEVAATIGRVMNGQKVVVTKSTVPVGTAARVRATIEALSSHRVRVCSNPEFLKEGSAVRDFLKPDRVVIGAEDPEATQLLRELHAPLRPHRCRHPRDGCGLRRAHQVRGECDACDPNLLHEFGGAPRGCGWGRRGDGAAWGGARSGGSEPLSSFPGSATAAPASRRT